MTVQKAGRGELLVQGRHKVPPLPARVEASDGGSIISGASRMSRLPENALTRGGAGVVARRGLRVPIRIIRQHLRRRFLRERTT
jgi:hypothetical protein